jgi:hypothetical protein
MRPVEMLACPCGTAYSPVAWRSGSKSYLYRWRCPRCGLQSSVAAARPERAILMWNEAVQAKRDAIMARSVR